MCKPKYLVTILWMLCALVAAMWPQASAAEPGWMVKGSKLMGTKALAATAAVDEEFELEFSELFVHCSGSTVNSVNPRINGATGMADASSLEFTKCQANTVCKLAKSMEEKITTLPILIDLTLDGSLAVKGRILPTSPSKILAFLEFEGPECIFGGGPITGTASFLMPTGQTERTSQLLYWASEDKEELKIGGFPAAIRGGWLERLANSETFSFL